MDSEFNQAIALIQGRNEKLQSILSQIKSDQHFYRDSLEVRGELSPEERLILLGAYLATLTQMKYTGQEFNVKHLSEALPPEYSRLYQEYFGTHSSIR